MNEWGGGGFTCVHDADYNQIILFPKLLLIKDNARCLANGQFLVGYYMQSVFSLLGANAHNRIHHFNECTSIRRIHVVNADGCT